MQLEEGGKLEWLPVAHEVLDGEDGAEVGGECGEHDGQGRQRCFAGDIGGQVVREGDVRQLGDDEVGESVDHGGRGGEKRWMEKRTNGKECL